MSQIPIDWHVRRRLKWRTEREIQISATNVEWPFISNIRSARYQIGLGNCFESRYPITALINSVKRLAFTK